MSASKPEDVYDAIVVGGSFAGLAAALQLARARRRVLVVDAGQRRNRFAASSHGFLGQDGRDPAAIIADARRQLLAYPTVTWREGAVSAARVRDGAPFELELAAGGTVEGRRVVLATGVVDELPDLPGVAERWGTHVFHCPYCHGYELGGGPVGVLATSPLSVHSALMLADWGATTLFTRGLFEPESEQLVALDRRGVTIDRTPVTRLQGGVEVVLADGRVVALAGVFLLPRSKIAGRLADQLGCALEDATFGAIVRTDPMRETTVRGVFACGDMALPAGSVSFAVADGARAGISAHQSLVFRGPDPR